MPASSRASSSNRPAGPTKGLPSRSSSFPGCSPTSIIFACDRPSPNTVWVAFSQSGQALQPAAASRSEDKVGLSGIKCSADSESFLMFNRFLALDPGVLYQGSEGSGAAGWLSQLAVRRARESTNGVFLGRSNIQLVLD